MSLVDGFKKFLESKTRVRVTGHEVVEAFERPPTIALGVENLYGVPVLDILDGYKGQIIGVEMVANYTDSRHRLPTMGLRLRLGYTMLFARLQSREEKRGRGLAGEYSYPIIVNGVVTPYIELLKRPEFKLYFYEYRTDVGEFQIAVDDAINIEQVMAGESPILVTDKYGVRTLKQIKEADKLLELSKLVEVMTYEIQKQQSKAEEERRNARMALSMADFYKRQLEDARDKIEKLSKEYYNIREELEKALELARVKLSQLEVTSHAEKTFQSLAEIFLNQIEPLARRLSSAIERVKSLAEAELAVAEAGREGEEGKVGEVGAG